MMYPRQLPVVVASLWAAFAAGDDWPALRGPQMNGSSSESGLADMWPDQGPPVLWSRQLGQGYSSFAVVGDRAYTQYQSVFGQFVICLDAQTGETIWETRHEAPYEAMGMYPGPRSTPAIVGDRLYFTSPDGIAGCLRVGDGDRVWTVNVNEKFGGRGADFGYSCSPLVLEGRVILPVGGENAAMVALDADTGDTLWTTGSDTASYCTAVPITLEGHTLIVVYLENALGLYNPKTGHQVWRTELSSGYDEHAAAPLYREPILVVSAPFRAGADAYRLAWDDAAEPPVIKATIHWQNVDLSNDVVSSITVDDLLFGFDVREAQSKLHRPTRGMFRCVDFETGITLWSTDRIGQASIIAADSKMLLFSDAGEVILSRMSRDGYTELSRIALFSDEVCWTPPALSGGRLFLRTQSRAACLHVGRPEQLPEQDSVRAITASEIASEAGADWGWLLNGEREHPFMRPDVQELTQWYLACLTAGGLPVLWLMCIPPASPRRLAWVILVLVTLMIFGIVATPLLNALRPDFLFTWPLALYSGLQITLVTIDWAERQPELRISRRRSRLVGCLLLLLCYGYFAILRALSLPHEWVFLLGLLPAFPIMVFSARILAGGSGRLATAACPIFAFTLYFWMSGAALWLKKFF